MNSLRKRDHRNVSFSRTLLYIPSSDLLDNEPHDCRLNIRRNMSERLLEPLESDFVFGSLSIFRRTQRQPEESEHTTQTEGVIRSGGGPGSTLANSEV